MQKGICEKSVVQHQDEAHWEEAENNNIHY